MAFYLGHDLHEGLCHFKARADHLPNNMNAETAIAWNSLAKLLVGYVLLLSLFLIGKLRTIEVLQSVKDDTASVELNN